MLYRFRPMEFEVQSSGLRDDGRLGPLAGGGRSTWGKGVILRLEIPREP
jgi:hypothetical protein